MEPISFATVVEKEFILMMRDNMGIPYQWHGEPSLPFIEHIENGKVTRTVNAIDVAEIVFAD